MAKSNGIIQNLKEQLGKLSLINTGNEAGKITFLRELLITLNKFFFEKRNSEEIEDLWSALYEGKDDTLPNWRRHTEFLAIWDDYAQKVLSFFYPEERITSLAKRLNEIFKNAKLLRDIPRQIDPDTMDSRLGSMTPREFVFIRIVHALQDFTRILPPINENFTDRLKTKFGKIPMPGKLKDREQALEFLTILGGADRNVDERIRYITDISNSLLDKFKGDPFLIFSEYDGDAKAIYRVLRNFTGIASKKANMILRDFYEYGIWLYRSNLEEVNIISDNRIMRVALRSGIIDFALPKLLNDLLDQYDYQYMMTAGCTVEAFRKVWLKCKELNSGEDIVTYPARFDSFFFHLANANTRQGPKGCCCPTDISCINNRKRDKFFRWLREELDYECSLSCPLLGICPDKLKKLNPPFAIQNNTWNTIFTNEGGGGGLRGI